MKFVTVRDLRGRPTKVWKDLKAENELVLTSNGKPMALLSHVSEDSLEGTLAALRRARAVEAVRAIQESSLKRHPRGLSLREINNVISEVRKSRRRTR